jgi:hypothetical protein
MGVGVHHAGDFLGELEQVDAVFGVAANDLLAFDVLQVVHEDVLAEHVDQGLDVCRHLLFVLGLHKLAEVAVGEGRHEELHVELVPAPLKPVSQLRTLTGRRRRRPEWVPRSPCWPRSGCPSPKWWR